MCIQITCLDLVKCLTVVNFLDWGGLSGSELLGSRHPFFRFPCNWECRSESLPFVSKRLCAYVVDFECRILDIM